ncbi:hypothetical protein MUK42_02656 [Musa troglodytarum]|uniref:Uncharacterized protein n=1 Tax=Musa troglodytarum TaxID=320322 RepID=A0A9E7ET60_9LILI|nr:hypothetical protein MUK42_02999 [Musa troglodytarum]URE41872.1 hypothetical protein MUK42_02656 [Musa troglodytarum]
MASRRSPSSANTKVQGRWHPYQCDTTNSLALGRVEALKLCGGSQGENATNKIFRPYPCSN